jgi:hypothetical protein
VGRRPQLEAGPAEGRPPFAERPAAHRQGARQPAVLEPTVERLLHAYRPRGRRLSPARYGSMAMASKPETEDPRQAMQQRSPSPAARRQPLCRRDVRRVEEIRSGLLLPRDRRSVAAPPRPRRRDVFRYAPQAARRRMQTRCFHRPAASAAEILHCAFQSAVRANRLSSDAPKGCKRSQNGLPCTAHQRCDQVRALPMPPHRDVIAGGRGMGLVVLEYGYRLDAASANRAVQAL